MQFPTPIVSAKWLYEHIHEADIIILDTTLPKVTQSTQETANFQINGARFFDIKNEFSDSSETFPNTLPTETQFNQAAQKLGINKSSKIVVYDDYGYYSCARAWWLFKAFGHDQVAILDGGLPIWKQAGYPIEDKQNKSLEKGDFQGSLNSEYFKFFNDIEVLKNDERFLILDARAKDRFDGSLAEPRVGLRSGHIANSVNLPFQQLLDENTIKTPEELKNIFNKINPDNKNMIFSCGSGVTACILALGAEISGYNDLSVYDGSWTEYGTLTKA